MGLIWSMQCREAGPPPAGASIRRADPWSIEVCAKAESTVLATVTLERLFAGPGVLRDEIREEGLVATLFTPPSPGSYPVVVHLSGSQGGFNEQVAALYASHGFAGLALAYFGIESLPLDMVEIPLEYFDRAFQWLRRRGLVSQAGIAVTGASKGGELALLLGATFPDVRCVIAYAPSGVVHAAESVDSTRRGRSTWSFGGKALPCVQFDPSRVDWRASAVVLRPGFLAALEDAERVQGATIPVERTNGPILLISGGADQLWPSRVRAEIVIKRLNQHQFAYPYEHLCYEEAGHNISLPPYRPSITGPVHHPIANLRFDLGGTTKANAHAIEDSWKQVLHLLSSTMQEQRGSV